LEVDDAGRLLRTLDLRAKRFVDDKQVLRREEEDPYLNGDVP
jgi:hypothetical protein